MTIIAIIVCIVLLGIVIYLPKATKHEACQPVNKIFGVEITDDNRQELSDAGYIIEHDVLPHILEYVRGKANRTVTIQCIMQSIQGHQSYMHLVDDRKWDYICEIEPRTHTVKAPNNDVVAWDGGQPLGIKDIG